MYYKYFISFRTQKNTYFRFILLNFKILLRKAQLEHLWNS